MFVKTEDDVDDGRTGLWRVGAAPRSRKPRGVRTSEIGMDTIFLYGEATRKMTEHRLTLMSIVFGKPLSLFSKSPMTGFYRNGYCDVGPDDGGVHAIAGKAQDGVSFRFHSASVPG